MVNVMLEVYFTIFGSNMSQFTLSEYDVHCIRN